MTCSHDWNLVRPKHTGEPVVHKLIGKVTADEASEFRKIVAKRKTTIESRVRELIRADIEQHGSLD